MGTAHADHEIRYPNSQRSKISARYLNATAVSLESFSPKTVIQDGQRGLLLSALQIALMRNGLVTRLTDVSFSLPYTVVLARRAWKPLLRYLMEVLLIENFQMDMDISSSVSSLRSELHDGLHILRYHFQCIH